MESQRSPEWYRKRLGKFTGSRIGDLLKKGRNKDEAFGETAFSYIYQVAAEREMNPVIVNNDSLFEEYLSQSEISSKAMRWGIEKESEARALYEIITNIRIVEVGLCVHPTITNFASSPDGFFCSDDIEKGSIEIKCVSQSVFMKYKNCIKDNETLLSTEPKYFFQCQSHMMCTGAEWCDFVVYNPFQKKPVHIARILPDNSCFSIIENRIKLADEIINEIIDK